MINIHFIINPIAGSAKNIVTEKYLRNHFEREKYNLVVKYSNYKKHAMLLTQESISQNANIIVACGGDGTLNEIASFLVNTPIILGIIPIGSGNGFASNLNIPKNINKAIEILKKQSVKQIDVGNINDKQFFISNTGIGLAADLVKYYEANEKRKISSYIRAGLKAFKEFKYKNELEITLNNETFRLKPLVVLVSNSNELGYNISLTPKASLQDGILDVLVVSKLSKIKILLFGILILFKKHHLLRNVKSFKTKNIKISSPNQESIEAQIDGEFYKLDINTITISVIHGALNVIA